VQRSTAACGYGFLGPRFESPHPPERHILDTFRFLTTDFSRFGLVWTRCRNVSHPLLIITYRTPLHHLILSSDRSWNHPAACKFNLPVLRSYSEIPCRPGRRRVGIIRQGFASVDVAWGPIWAGATKRSRGITALCRERESRQSGYGIGSRMCRG
jgi:hypothetical protein